MPGRIQTGVTPDAGRVESAALPGDAPARNAALTGTIEIEGAAVDARDAAAAAAPGAGALVATRPRPLIDITPQAAATRSAPRRRRRGLWIGLAAALAAGVGGWLMWAQPWAAGPTTVAIETVTPGPVTRVLAVNGRIAALHSVSVRSTVAGTLVDPIAEEGDVVAQGAVLARLDDTPQKAVMRQAEAALEQGVVAAQKAADALARAEALGATVSRVTLDDARRAEQQAEQEVGRLTALVDQAQFQLTRYSITAPIAGTVLTRSVDPGQVVDLSSELFTLADLGELIVETDVDETYATQIRPGMSALLLLTGETQPLDGVVLFVAPVVDATTGGLLVKIAFAKPRPAPVGLTVTANIVVDRQAEAMSAPRSAIVTEGQGDAVFLLVDGVARRTPVTVVDWPAERLLVTSGLSAGARLIVDASGLSDGQPVSVAGQ